MTTRNADALSTSGSQTASDGALQSTARRVTDFAALVEQQQRERMANEYPRIDLDAPGSYYKVAVHVGPKYTRVDWSGSGKYMVVNATGEIFGIKAYGVIHRGHAYGTLDTIHEWDWSDYVARRLAP